MPDRTEAGESRACPRCAHRPHVGGYCKARYRVTFEKGEPGDPCLCEVTTHVWSERIIERYRLRISQTPTRVAQDQSGEHPYNGGTCCDQPMVDHTAATVEWVASQKWDGPVDQSGERE